MEGISSGEVDTLAASSVKPAEQQGGSETQSQEILRQTLEGTRAILEKMKGKEGGVGLSFEESVVGTPGSIIYAREVAFAGREDAHGDSLFVNVLTHGKATDTDGTGDDPESVSGSTGIYLVAIRNMSEKSPLIVVVNQNMMRNEVRVMQTKDTTFDQLVEKSKAIPTQSTYDGIAEAAERDLVDVEQIERVEFIEIERDSGYAGDAGILKIDESGELIDAGESGEGFTFLPTETDSSKPDRLSQRIKDTLAPMREGLSASIRGAQVNSKPLQLTPAHFSLN